MKSNYTVIIGRNLEKLYTTDVAIHAAAMGAEQINRTLTFKAFGAACTITPQGILLDEQPQTGPLGVILSLYALHATPDSLVLEPFKAFKELPNSMPYVGAFASHTEQILGPSVEGIIKNDSLIMDHLDGAKAPAHVSGDAALVVRPLPKVALCYILYAADEDFPASATCLFSNNAHAFMPIDGLADVGEYTSRVILDLTNLDKKG